jgi:hypothetical protein
MSRLATATYFVPGARDRGVTLSREALEMARRLEHPLTLELALLGRRWALWEPAHLPERLAIATELVHLAETSGTRELALQARAWRVGDLLELGEIEAVDAEIEAYGRFAAELGQPSYLWLTSMFGAMRALLATAAIPTEHFATAEHSIPPGRVSAGWAMRVSPVRSSIEVPWSW